MTFTQAWPEIDNLKAGNDSGKGREQADQHECLNADAFCIDPHQFGAVGVVADQIDVRAKLMTVEQYPSEKRDHDQPDHLRGKRAANFSDQGRMEKRLFHVTQGAALALRKNQHRAAPEELGAYGCNQRRNAEFNDDQAIEPANQSSGQERGNKGQYDSDGYAFDTRRGSVRQNEGDHAHGHDGWKRKIHFAGDDQQRQWNCHDGKEGDGRHEGIVDLGLQEGIGGQDNEDDPQAKEDPQNSKLRPVCAGKPCKAKRFFVRSSGRLSSFVCMRSHPIHPFHLIEAAGFCNSNHLFHERIKGNVFCHELAGDAATVDDDDPIGDVVNMHHIMVDKNR